MPSDELQYVVNESDLYEVYSLLADATQAAATGDTNACASKAADAKTLLESVHEDGALLHEVDDAE